MGLTWKKSECTMLNVCEPSLSGRHPLTPSLCVYRSPEMSLTKAHVVSTRIPHCPVLTPLTCVIITTSRLSETNSHMPDSNIGFLKLSQHAATPISPF